MLLWNLQHKNPRKCLGFQVSDTSWLLRKLGERENQETGESLPLAPPTYLDWILWNHHLWWLQNENSVRPLELTHSLSRKCSSKIKIKIFQIREKKKKRSATSQDALFPGELSGCYRVSRAIYAPWSHLPRTTGRTPLAAQWIKIHLPVHETPGSIPGPRRPHILRDN